MSHSIIVLYDSFDVTNPYEAKLDFVRAPLFHPPPKEIKIKKLEDNEIVLKI